MTPTEVILLIMAFRIMETLIEGVSDWLNGGYEE